MDRSVPLNSPVCCDVIATPTTTPSRSRLGLSRRDIIAAHWLPNGDLRFFRQDAKMGGYLSLYVIISAIPLPPSLRLTSIM